MSEKQINDLPNEVIGNILCYLNQADLSNATLTCKLWNNIIASSCRWSVELYHNNKVDVNEHWIDFMLSTDRKFKTIKMNMMLDINRNKTLEIFQKHGFYVLTLSLIDSYIDSFIKFAKLLNCMPNLEHVIVLETLTIGGVHLLAPPEQDLPDLRKLKTLEMVSSEYSIVKCFEKAKLTTIKVFNSMQEYAMDCKPLEDFLKSQKMLTTLAFRSVHHETSMLFRTENLNNPMPFHLSRLSLLNMRLQESPNDYNNLLRFVKPHAKTLKEFELGHYFPSFVFEFVFANMTKLHTFSLLMTEIPKEMEFYERLEENRSIENLIFTNSAMIDDSQFLCEFLKKLPNVRSLNLLEYCGNGAFVLLAQSLPKIESLGVHSFNEEMFEGAQFPNLKTLQIVNLCEKVDWNEFTKANPQLTELTIQTVFDKSLLNSDDIENITTNIGLESLRLGGNFSADKRFFETIRKNGTNLKILDLHKLAISSELDEQMDCKVLRLCDDNVIKCSKYPTIWNEDYYDGRFPPDEVEWDVGGAMLDPFDVNLINFDLNDWDDLHEVLDDEDYDLDYGDYYDDYHDFSAGSDTDTDTDTDSERR